MKSETCEFRVNEDFAPLLFKDDEGVRLGTSVRKIVLRTDDPRYTKVGEMSRHVRQISNTFFFAGWKFHRTYTNKELAEAELFNVEFLKYFEPAGEEHGTPYDEKTACPVCGSGALQVGPLCLPPKRLPKGKDFACTIGGERIASWRVKQVFEREGVSGIRFAPVISLGKASRQNPDWFQFFIESATARIVVPTRLGNGPFDDDEKGMHRCPTGDQLGLNRLSEVTIERATRGISDFVCSEGFVGVRRGLLRPERLIFISQRVRHLIDSERLKGLSLEVAHMV